MRYTIPATRDRRGFTLVITLTLMILLTLLAVGMLSLSAISLRTSTRSMDMAAARANARLSLMLAIGQLQVEMGPDARISATSGILDADSATRTIDGVVHPRLTGVWPAAVSRVASFQLDRGVSTKTLRRWLISGNPNDIKTVAVARTGYGGSVTTRSLVSAGSMAVLQRGVQVPVLSGDKAGFAWWTSDNGVKSTLRVGEKPDPASSSKALLGMRRSEADGHAALDPRLPNRTQGFDGRTLDLAAVDTAMPKAVGEQRIAWSGLHDLTTQSEFVPVDVSTGGLRKCLNLRLDWLEAQSAATRAAEGTFGQLGGDASKDYRLFSWDQLRNYESLARSSGMLTLDPSTKRPSIRCHKEGGFSGTLGEPEWNPNIGTDRFRVQPVLLKLCYVVSYATELLTAPTDPAKPYALRLYLYPMVVMWNPYNVDLVVPEYCVTGFCPLIFNINPDKAAPDNVLVDLTKNQSATMLAFGPEMGDSKTTNVAKMTNLVIPAGTTKVLYPQVVNWKGFPTEYRHNRFIWHYYMWADPAQKFNLGDNNFGGVLKNLRGNQSVAYFNSQPASEIMGAAGDTLRVGVTPSAVGPSYAFGMDAAHTDWWGNNGTGGDNAETLQKFGVTTSAKYRVETDGSSPQISLIKDTELPVRTFGQLVDKPTPLLFYECYRKAADEDLFPGKYGSFSVAGNAIHAYTDKSLGADAVTPWFESPYTFRFKAINSWFDVTKTFQLPPGRDDRVYFGASYSPRGQLNVVDQEIPVSPLVSLAQLQHLPLFDYRPIYDPATKAATTIWYGGDYGFHEGRETQFAQNHAIGNSFASPGIASTLLQTAGWKYQFNVTANHLRVDRSFIANSLLWDAWFCSSVAAQDGALLLRDAPKRTAAKVFEDFVAGTTPLPADAMRASLTQPIADVRKILFDSSGNPTKDAYTRIAEFLRIDGGFNINSVSEEAWAHFLSGMLSRPSLSMDSVTGKESPAVVAPKENQFLISRHALANAGPAERATGQERENRYWNGSREITADQIRELAAAMVVQVKKRGPFVSLAEFVNRRLDANTALAASGAMQSALDDPSVSINAPFRSDTLTGAETTSAGKPVYPFPDAAKGPRRQGITGYVTQADLLESVGPLISPRSDTFTIRTLGEARDSSGRVVATAWCEAVVQRTAAYVDPGDPASTATTALKQTVNKTFGRRFEIVSFRWLDSSEI